MTPATEWLAGAAVGPQRAMTQWQQRGLADLRAGARWDLIEVDLRLATLARGQLHTWDCHIGPRLVSGTDKRVWWLLPLGTGSTFDGIDGVTVRLTGWILSAPAPGRYSGGRDWQLPEDPRNLTQPSDLRAALVASGSSWRVRTAGTAR
jgi:hypothetical protein